MGNRCHAVRKDGGLACLGPQSKETRWSRGGRPVAGQPCQYGGIEYSWRGRPRIADMKIVLVHNHYQQQGGEDAVFADEAGLLEARGHQVIRYTLHNDTIADMSRWQVAQRTLWNRQVYRELSGLLRREKPAVMHCTNTFP